MKLKMIKKIINNEIFKQYFQNQAPTFLVKYLLKPIKLKMTEF